MPMTATTYEALPNRSYLKKHMTQTHEHSMAWMAPLGRFLFSLMFVISGISHFSAESIQMAICLKETSRTF